jgi:hypothetical protein
MAMPGPMLAWAKSTGAILSCWTIFKKVESIIRKKLL